MLLVSFTLTTCVFSHVFKFWYSSTKVAKAWRQIRIRVFFFFFRICDTIPPPDPLPAVNSIILINKFVFKSVLLLDLPVGEHQYKFYVDDTWTHDRKVWDRLLYIKAVDPDPD